MLGNKTDSSNRAKWRVCFCFLTHYSTRKSVYTCLLLKIFLHYDWSQSVRSNWTNRKSRYGPIKSEAGLTSHIWDMWEVLTLQGVTQLSYHLLPSFPHVRVLPERAAIGKCQAQLRTERNPNFLSPLQRTQKYDFTWISIPSWSADKVLESIQMLQQIQSQLQRYECCLESWRWVISDYRPWDYATEPSWEARQLS